MSEDEAAEEKEYMVHCRISGTATVFLTAKNEDHALDKASRGDYRDCELAEWSIQEVEDAEINE